MSENIVQLIFFSHLLVATFLLTLNKGNLLSNKLLACFLLITAIDLSNFIFYDFYGNHLNLDMLRANTSALLAPALYFYVRSVLYNDTKFHLKYLLHFLPLLSVLLIFLPRFYLGDIEQKSAFYDNSNPLTEVILVHFIVYIQLAFYLCLIYKDLIKYKKLLLENFSEMRHLNHRWLTYFILFFTVDFIITLSRNIFKFTEYQSLTMFLTPFMLFTSLLFVCWILIQALQNPHIFLGISSNIKLIPHQALDLARTKKGGLGQSDNLELEKSITALKHFMMNNRPYLNATLTIEVLAKQLNLPTEELSSMINHHIGQHFFDFVNTYRVKLAAKMLQAQEDKDKTILTILYEVGFNSKSSFNTAFKKHMAMTPSQYRKLG